MSKTGLTAAAGWCVGMVVDRVRQKYVVVVLGSKTKAARFSTVKTTMTRYVVDN
jgi:D-alanyl-D-alanine carboxypeptidase